MTLSTVRVQSIRSYDLFSAELSPSVTLILGRNGTGKTSLLEAMYYISQGTSFRGRDRDMVAHSATRGEIVAQYKDDSTRRATLAQQADDKIKKTFVVQSKTTQRLTHPRRKPVVLFEPEELRLISSSPERRRRFLDDMLSRLYPQYGTLLARYQRTVVQRNELLKQREQLPESQWDTHLFTWDITFAELAEQIVNLRREFMTISNTKISDIYSGIADTSHHVTVKYQTSITSDNYKQTLLNKLHELRVADSYRGFTSVGPHRDDFSIALDGHLASETASRGEMRTIMLAYKLLEVELQQEIYGSSPLILMDDVFSELDTTREQHLMKSLSPHQTIITATDLRDELKIDATIITL